MLEIKSGSNKFYIGESENDPIAYISYVHTGEGAIIIDSTYVTKEMGGQGIAKQLLKTAVDWARKEDKKIIPVCPYVKYQMEKNPEYHDMIHK